MIVVEINIALNHHYPFTGFSLGFKVLSLQPFRLFYLYLLFYAILVALIMLKSVIYNYVKAL